VASLRELAVIVVESDCNHRCIEATTAIVVFLVSLVKNHAQHSKNPRGSEVRCHVGFAKGNITDGHILDHLHSLKLSFGCSLVDLARQSGV
jgi:hypothetical protein